MRWLCIDFCPADFNTPFQPPGQVMFPVGGKTGAPSEEDIAMIVSLGFSRQQAEKALKATVSNLNRGRACRADVNPFYAGKQCGAGSGLGVQPCRGAGCPRGERPAFTG